MTVKPPLITANHAALKPLKIEEKKLLTNTQPYFYPGCFLGPPEPVN